MKPQPVDSPHRRGASCQGEPAPAVVSAAARENHAGTWRTFSGKHVVDKVEAGEPAMGCG